MGLKIFFKLGKIDNSVSQMGKGFTKLNTAGQIRCEVNQNCVHKANMFFNVLHHLKTSRCA